MKGRKKAEDNDELNECRLKTLAIEVDIVRVVTRDFASRQQSQTDAGGGADVRIVAKRYGRRCAQRLAGVIFRRIDREFTTLL